MSTGLSESTENLLDPSYQYDSVIERWTSKNRVHFQLLAKKAAGQRYTLKDCYLLVSATIRQVCI